MTEPLVFHHVVMSFQQLKDVVPVSCGLQLERSFKFMREAEDQLKVIPQFCFPDAKDWAPVDTFPRYQIPAIHRQMFHICCSRGGVTDVTLSV